MIHVTGAVGFACGITHTGGLACAQTRGMRGSK